MKIAWACPFYGPTPPLVGDSQRANIINAMEAGIEIIDDYSVSGTQHRNACEMITQRAAEDERIDAVFWTEHDVILPPDALQQLVKTLEETPEADMATGILFRRSPPYNPIISFRDPNFTEEDYERCKTHRDPQLRRVAAALGYDEMKGKMLKALNRLNTEEPPFPCDTASMGAVLFRRRVLQRMAQVSDAFAIDPHGLFSIDSIFFMRCKDQGFRLYCNPKVLCGHLGDQVIVDWTTWHRHMSQIYERFDIEKQARLREERGPLDRIYGELTRLMNQYGSDKGTLAHLPSSGWLDYTHAYCDFYEAHLDEIRLEARRVLELGVWKGASLRAWRDYFPNAQVYGIDLECETSDFGNRITVALGDVSDRETIRQFAEGLDGPLDLIVDDASHLMRDQQIALAALFPYLRPGGYYILEDLHTSFLGGTWGVNEGATNTTVKFLEALAHHDPELFSEYLTPVELDYLKAKTESVLLYGKRSMTSLIRKKGRDG